MAEESTYIPERGIRGRLWENQRFHNMEMLGSVSFGFYQGIIQRIGDAGGVVEYARQKDLNSDRVRELVFQLSAYHAYPIVAGRLSETRAKNRFTQIQQGFYFVFNIAPSEEYDVTCLGRSEITEGLFDSPQLPYELTGDLRTLMVIEFFLPDDVVWEIYDFIAITRANLLLEVWRDGAEGVRSFLVLHSIVRGSVFPNPGARAGIIDTLREHPGGQFEQAFLNTMYYDQLFFIISTLGSLGYGSRRVADVLAYHAEGDLSEDPISGQQLDDAGNLGWIQLESERAFTRRLQHVLESRQCQ